MPPHLAAVAAVAVASAAGAADDLTGQVVVVLVAAAAAGTVAVERRLDAVEGVLVDERLVAALSCPGSTETFLFGIPALDEMGR